MHCFMKNPIFIRFRLSLVASSFLLLLGLSSCQEQPRTRLHRPEPSHSGISIRSARTQRTSTAAAGQRSEPARQQGKPDLLGLGAPLSFTLGAANGLGALLLFAVVIAVFHLGTARSIEKTARDYRASQRIRQGLRREYNGLE
jgi:hypothetical protein